MFLQLKISNLNLQLRQKIQNKWFMLLRKHHQKFHNMITIKLKILLSNLIQTIFLVLLNQKVLKYVNQLYLHLNKLYLNPNTLQINTIQFKNLSLHNKLLKNKLILKLKLKVNPNQDQVVLVKILLNNLKPVED